MQTRILSKIKKPAFSILLKKYFFTEYDITEMAGQFLKFGTAKIKNIKFLSSKHPFNVSDVDIEKILVSDEFGYSQKKKRMQNKSYNIKLVKILLIRLEWISQ